MPTPPRLSDRPQFWLGLFALYVLAQAAVRVALGDRVNIDEAEALLWAQRLDWGYGPQPPLYIWAQGAVFALTGPGVVGLALWKALVLWGIAATGFALARRFAGPGQVAVAGLATLALLWLPELSWESQRIRTHNTLATLIALAAVLVALQLRRDPRGPRFAQLGALIGLGLLAKWNFILLVPGLLLALALAPGGARALGRPAALWLVLLPVAMVSPTALWMAAHPEVAFASAGKLGLAAEGAAWARWLTAWGRNFAGFIALPVLVLGAFALAGRRRVAPDPAREPSSEAATEMRITLGAVAITLALVLIGGLIGGATQMTARWFLPLALPALPVVGVRVVGRLGGLGRAVFTGLSAALAALLLVAIGVMLTRDPPLPHVPLAEIAAALPPTPGDATILAPVALAGNLALLARDRRLTDAAGLLVGPCPARLHLLSTAEAPHPGLAPFLGRCGLRLTAQPQPLIPGQDVTLSTYSR